MKQEIFLRRQNKVIVAEGQSNLDAKYIAALLKNIEKLGYTISEKLAERLLTLSLDDLSRFYDEFILCLRKQVGADVQYKPMYPNFPKQVEKMSLEQLFSINALHYLGNWIGVRIMPDFEKEKRPALTDNVKLKVIDLGTDKEFETLMRTLFSAKASLSETDKQDIGWAINTYSNRIGEFLPNELPHKENMTYICGLLILHISDAHSVVQRFINTATDVLRLITAMSGGDVSLASNTKFRNITRYERRFLLGLLENCGGITEDMLRHKNKWIRVGERLHPFEYKKRFPETAEAFDVLRNNKPFQTFNAIVEKAIAERNTNQAVKLLKTRPGEFARRLDFLLRTTDNTDLVLEGFGAVAGAVSTTVLLQVIAHFEGRNDATDLRVFFPKGVVAKAFAIENELPPIDESICNKIIATIKESLKSRFALLKPLGTVYLDEQMKKYTVPLSQRSASKALRSVARGSRLGIPDGNTIRFFLWWKEGVVNGSETDTVDVDLSAVIYDKNWRYQEHVSYTNLKSDTYKIFHSGDITSAPNGACEFIDLDIAQALKHEARYVVMSLNAYSLHPFCDLPECYAGWMIRQKPQSGEIFEPRTVQDKIDITANTTISIPVILDLEAREIVWTDLSLTQDMSWYNNIEGNLSGMTIVGQAMTSIRKPDLYTLLKLHVEARGEFTENRDEADLIFSETEGVTPYDSEKILSEYL